MRGSKGQNGAIWTPALPTTEGGLLPHTWHHAGGTLYQDAGQTTPAVAEADPVGASVNLGSDTHVITQSTSSARMTLRLNALNGHPVFYLDGGDSLAGTFNAAISQPYTEFIVAQLWYFEINTNQNYYLVDGIAAGGRGSLWARKDDLQTTRCYNQWALYGGATLAGGRTNDRWNVWRATFNGANSELHHNGVEVVAGDTGNHALAGLTLGGRFDGTSRWKGFVAEHLIYSGVLSAADEAQVRGYLATKYGVTAYMSIFDNAFDSGNGEGIWLPSS